MVDYSKWDDLETEIEEDVEQQLDASSLRKGQLKPCQLYSLCNDSYSEKIRWALDIHRISYTEEEYPYGLHWIKYGELLKAASLKVPKSESRKEHSSNSSSDPIPARTAKNYNFPFLITHDEEILRKDTTQILTYIYSRSLFSPIKLYSSTKALDWETYFDEKLAPAAHYIYWSSITMTIGYLRHYLLDNIYWKTHRRLYECIWPLIWIRWNLLTWNKKRKMNEAIHSVEEVMSKVTEHLDREKHKYLCGDKFSAADLTFSSHASLILWPNRHEDYLDKIKLHIPHIESVNHPRLVNFVRHWKETLAGKHAIRMCRIHRGTNFGQRPSRYDQQHNPWWTYGNLGLYLPWSILILSLWIGLFPVWGTRFIRLKTLFAIDGIVLMGLGIMFIGFRCVYRETYRDYKERLLLYGGYCFGKHV